MTHRPIKATLLGAALALLTSSLVGTSGLVLCVGSDGHRVLEREHEVVGCPSLESTQRDSIVSVARLSVCFDLPAGGNGLIAPSSFDAKRVLSPPMASLAPRFEAPPRLETLISASADARAGPSNLALHLTSTVLLV